MEDTPDKRAAHIERVELDRQIEELTAKLVADKPMSTITEHHDGLMALHKLQRERRAAFRRENGYPP
ncbi:hypothetical protein [Nocardia bovistercoris]|uniref:Uncharacterized protein n=1 Tax=Nocardia bovistercoris TaxID=2785916 RepID=A0A931ICB9_9NOCA|nr:hypothetical protein [Nocardia bovistercoris]MBH0778794.1 hypothetical protein [Nocardia bovistercoris]